MLIARFLQRRFKGASADGGFGREGELIAGRCGRYAAQVQADVPVEHLQGRAAVK